MAFAIAIEPELIRVTFSGTLTAEDLRGIAAAVDEVESTGPVPNRISDLTAITDVQVGYQDVLALAERRRSVTFPNDFKSALVVRGSAQLGMARMFQTLNDNPRITIQIFADVEDALSWLRR